MNLYQEDTALSWEINALWQEKTKADKKITDNINEFKGKQ
jgi:hypothetical protein